MLRFFGLKRLRWQVRIIGALDSLLLGQEPFGMSTIVQPASTTETARSSSPRTTSIDVFRGITMAVMIFVNALDGVRGLPWWTHHAHVSEDRMTYVDMVYPFFLFAIGLSLPIAIERRLRRNPSQFALWTHILLRSLSLIVLGLILANAEKADHARAWE